MKEGHGRIQSIDILRGAVMMLMLLDHTRSYWNEGTGIDPLDLGRTYPALFATRWVTHLCAPLFVLLTGISAWLSKERRGQTARGAARDLALRGTWIVLLELLVISCLWGSVPAFNGILFQVIGAIGVSLLALAALQFLPSAAVAILGLVVIGGHNLIPDFHGLGAPAQLLWDLFHQRGTVAFSPSWKVDVLYPVLPWMAVMALGYGLGPLFADPAPRRRLVLAASGLGALALLVVLRAFTAYGDPRPFVARTGTLLSFMDFINLEKYPPSLLFLLATIGPGLIVLAFLDRLRLRDGHLLLVFGRTPLFFYVIHLPLVALTTIPVWLIGGVMPAFAFPLWLTYLVWLALIPALYLLCRGYGRFKFGKRRWWTAYM